MAGLALGTQAWFFEPDSMHRQTLVFTVLGFSQLAHVLAIRSERESLLTQGLLSNAPLAAAVGLTISLQLAVIYIPPLNQLFTTEPLSAVELAMALGISALVFVAVELEKWVKRKRGRQSSDSHRSDGDLRRRKVAVAGYKPGRA
jgi:P-type Ca2+ transporter type 2C